MPSTMLSRVVFQRAEVLRQRVAHVGKLVDDGLVGRSRQWRGQLSRDARMGGDGIQVMPVPNRAFDAGFGFGEADPGAGLAIQRAAQQAVGLELQLALSRQLGQHPFVVGQGEGEAAAVGVEMGGLPGQGEIEGLGEADFLGGCRGRRGQSQKSQ
jgi:hypothetical protein